MEMVLMLIEMSRGIFPERVVYAPFVYMPLSLC